MSREEARLLIERAEEIEGLIGELVERIPMAGTGVEILSTGLKKTIVSVVYNVNRCFSSPQAEKSMCCLQKSLSLLRTLEYYNYISRKAGCVASSPYGKLTEKMKCLERHLLFSLRKTRSRMIDEMNNLPQCNGARFRPSLQDPGKGEEKLLIF